MVTANSYPQSGDIGYAEDFATHVGHESFGDYVSSGLELTNIDYTNGTATVTSGKAFVFRDKASKTNGETVLDAVYAVHVSETGISLTDGATNYVYVQPDVDSNDSPSISVYTDTSNASGIELLIGTIDTSNDTFELRNRNPDVEVDEFRAYLDLGIPVYDDLSNAVTGEGNVAYATGNGPNKQGIWMYTASGWKYSGIESFDDDQVQGVTGLIEDTAANRPAAGIEGRIFFESDTPAIYYDDGSSWVRLAVDASQIGPADLGFNTATQSELDTHASTGDAHHSKTTTLDELSDSDATEIIADTESNRPTAGTNGRVFIASDTEKIYYDNGSSWLTLGVSSHDNLTNINTDDHHPQIQFSDSGTAVLTQPTDVDLASNLSVTDDTDGTITIDLQQGSGSGLDADLLDGVQLSNINWADVALSQSDVNVSDLGTADSSLNMGSYQLSLDDGVDVALGTNNDTGVHYDATNDDIRWTDKTNASDRMALDRTTGDLTVEGTITEGATL